MKTVTKTRVAALLSYAIRTVRKFCGHGDHAIVKRNGFVWDLDLAEGIDLAIFLFSGFEPETTEEITRLVRPGSTVLDIGANIGSITLVLAQLVGTEGRVYAFEPTTYAVQKLRRNLALNQSLRERVTVEQVRLTCEKAINKPVEIYSSWKLVGDEQRHPKHRGIAQSTEGAATLSLDAYCKEQRISKVDFIKLDVDGFEGEVLAGAINLLKRDRPPICMELAPYALVERGSSVQEVFGILEACGYRVRPLSGGPKAFTDPYALARKVPDGAGINILVTADHSASVGQVRE
jgi:FkbM family methyltransferase